MQISGLLTEREMKHGQMLDTMDIEQEKMNYDKITTSLLWIGNDMN
jgi:translation elongation factor EF-4